MASQKRSATPTLRLQTESTLAAGGDALARHPDGRIVFVVGAAPDEEVEVRIVKDNASFLRAEVVRVVKAGPHRVKPPCPHFSRCGGCSLQHVEHGAQIESKQAALQDTLTRIGHVDLEQVDVEAPWVGAPYGYRTRVRLVLSGKGEVGFRQPKSRRVVDVRQCPVLAPELQDILTTLRAAKDQSARARPDHRRGGDAEVSLVSNGAEVLANFPEGHAALASAVAKVAGPKMRSGDAALADAEDGFGPLPVSPRVFAQGSRSGNAALLEHLQTILPEKVGVALDLYSGCGNFTRLLAPRAERVEAFEGAREAVALARRSAPENTTVHLGAVDKELAGWAESGGGADLVLLDPPRVGADDAVVQGILQLAPKTVVYVSCNPATFARDAAKLEAGGLRLRRVRLFDLYPQTGHSELVGVFSGENPAAEATPG